MRVLSPQTKAFTLIELLIVVAIIAILAAIAVPNFLEAQVRSKVSRAQADMRTINTALEAYYVDNNAYPPSVRNSPVEPIPRRGSAWMDRRMLTTPISYITTVPPDPFVARDPGPQVEAGKFNVYGIHDRGTSGTYDLPFNSWMMWSVGPDLRTNTGGYRKLEMVERGEAAQIDWWNQTQGAGTSNYPGHRYDPTNGTVSLGDIYRFGPNSLSYHGQL